MPAVSMPPPILVGRLGRAAIFAGATLTGCVVAPPPQQPPPPPPDDHQQHRDHAYEPPPPPPPPPDGTFAKPPISAGTITGVVTGDANGLPISGTTVYARRGGERPLTTQTDANGRYTFHAVPAGTYEITVMSSRPSNPRIGPPPPARGQVVVADGASAQLDLAIVIYVQPVDHGPCCKPYGAPPARRRLV